MGSTLDIGSDFETAKAEVIAAMHFPRDERLRTAYKLRNAWARRAASDPDTTASAGEIRELLDLPSRQEVKDAADEGIKAGTVAGDVLAVIYEQWRIDAPEPSMRAGLKRYTEWAIGKTYGDATPLKRSLQTLRLRFDAASPSAHLWAALRLMKTIPDDDQSYRDAFTPTGLPILLGVARAVQDFAESFIPKRTKPAKPIINGQDMHRVPKHIAPLRLL